MLPHSASVAMLLVDARLPVGGHTQSGTLEGALTSPEPRLAADAIPAYLATRLATVVVVEAGTAVLARHHLATGRSPEPVVAAWAARTASPALRRTSRTMARSLLRLADRLCPGDPTLAVVGGLAAPPRPVVMGGLAVAVGLGAEDLARVIAYDDLQTVAAAALKLVPTDPYDAAGWVHRLLPVVDALATRVAGLRDPGALPAPAAPLIEQWAGHHAGRTRRLFHA